eukprot:scaffold128716_cov60-Phaeocystis_antarctica.AAC.1
MIRRPSRLPGWAATCGLRPHGHPQTPTPGVLRARLDRALLPPQPAHSRRRPWSPRPCVARAPRARAGRGA